VPPKHKNAWWSVDEARAFLESARTGNDPLYAAYVLVLVLGLRRGWDPLHQDPRYTAYLRVPPGRSRCAPRVAMQVLKHSQIAVTMQVYSEVPSDATKDALRRLGESLDG
jgi:hypothetical protein